MSLPFRRKDQHTDSSSASKVAIPRIPLSTVPESRRTKRACIACREQKSKCSGSIPCSRCVGFGISCEFAEGKRERAEKYLEVLERKNKLYEGVLRYLQSRVESHDEDLITKTLDESGSDSSVPTKGVLDVASSPPDRPSVGAEYVDEDYNRNRQLQSFGFVGGPSEVSWIKHLRRDIERNRPTGTESPIMEVSDMNLQPLSSVSHFLDDIELAIDGNVALYSRPEREVADKLLNLYFHTVHASFPIVGKVPFMQQYVLYYSRLNMKPPGKWLAILNLIFALGAKYAALLSEPWLHHVDMPVSYFSRAQKLGFTHSQHFDHPCLQQIQVEGLTAFFLMSIGHINRAWRTCGFAVRSSIAMGINLRSESSHTSDTSKELRYRVWWAIYTLENTLSIMTGRPTSTADRFCTTPLPLPYEEDQFQGPIASRLLSSFSVRRGYMQDFESRRLKRSSQRGTADDVSSGWKHQTSTIDNIAPSNSLYFLHFVEITRVIRKGINLLYAPGFSKEPWFRIHGTISDLVNEADIWLSGLPHVFQFKPMQYSRIFERQRWSLAFRFYSLKITVTRPALCRSDRQRPDHGYSRGRQRNAAEICVDSACEMLDLLPGIPNIVWLIKVSPWWCVLHYLMQSITVLLIELDLCINLGIQRTVNVTSSVKKGLYWLQVMGMENIAAHRAWDVCHGLFCSISQRTTGQTSPAPYLPEVVHSQANWNTEFNVGQDDQQLTEPHLPLPENTIVHPTLHTMYDELQPCDLNRDVFQ
ncbi:putative fungal-specific transcription factor [Aspergillus ambiguus]|uniref:putative C6 transcription factor n=1 Tax=Aspergillus ambiguus TaxID=176160 RepID=UPI003CCD6E30